MVAVLGCAVALGISAVLAEREDAAAEVQMDRRTTAAAETVRFETRRYVDALRMAAAAAGAQQTLTAPEYAGITEPLRDMRLAGVSSVAFVVPAANGNVARVQQTWRDRGATGLTLAPQGDGDHAFTVFVTTLDGRPVPTGIDMLQASAPAAVLAEARRSRDVSVSDTYQLLADQTLPPALRQNSFVLAAPVYQASEFLGWVQLAVRGQSFMGATFAQAGQGLLDLSLRADDSGRRPVTVAELRSAAAGERDLDRTVSVPVADGTWTLHVAAVSNRLPGAHTGLPLAVAGGGLSLTALLTALVWVLVTSRERAQARVRAATADLRAGEAETRRQAVLLQAVLDGISDGVGVVGPDGGFLLHNPAARRILGESGSHPRPDSWPEHFGLFRLDGVPFPAEEMPLARALAGESSDQVEILVRNDVHPDGRVISVSARPLETASGERGAVAVFHDITDRKHVETELRGFAGVVAHDLRSPLTTVRGFAEMISDALAAEPADLALARRGADKVITGAVRMEQLITELLDYTAARDATLRIAEVSLHAIVDDVVTARVDAPDGADLRPDVFVGRLPVVLADPVLLRQVIDNLVGNAIKYTPPGQAPRIDITARAGAGGAVSVQIADRGIGIPDGEHGAVFDSFHRASNGTTHPGTGLGLAICRRIVERHGGHIEAAPNPGGGTIFTFTLPASAVGPSVTEVTAGAASG
ncbi:CHASE domain-containing protein [Actinoplanes sp. NEAU-A11]|uniref:Sensor-like histidine kinase SenX3 n=1 Tax=Actinoplanes aureus TaxID=2792083 RepID=A0A931CC08_9ACTN|nr:CHASE domain-containing protein [Actinoplanes aureus]